MTMEITQNITIASMLISLVFTGCTEHQTNQNVSPSPIIWTSPGGNGTVVYDAVEPFMKIITSIDEEEIVSISQGRELFISRWIPAPASRNELDGLGPLFNTDACTACHVSDGRVAPYLENGILDASFLLRTSNEIGEKHPLYGGQLQTKSTAGIAEANVSWRADSKNKKVTFVVTPDIRNDGYHIGGRMAPHLLGTGLINLISESTILEYADIDDKDGDGISGRPHWVIEENQKRIGRFGWKAINATLRTQNAGALHQDMGLTSPVHPQENCTEAQNICLTETNGGTPEVSETSLQAIVNFMTALGVPQRRIDNQAYFDHGAKLFESIGCVACHRPIMTTGVSPKFKSLSNQRIYPYTDLLLHDMGEELNDGVTEINASGREWRTPPLWGIGIVAKKAGARFLHDGRATTIREAIEAHGGEAQQAQENFIQLDEADKEKLLDFLKGI